MITEHALLPVKPGMEDDFMTAFGKARNLMAQTPGFIDLSLSRSIETPNEFLLLVRWESVEAHTMGFRGSANYAQWSAALHHFYEPFPVVEHFAVVYPSGTRPGPIPASR